VSDEDCLFCKIASGDIPAEVVHESETTVAFRDLSPQAPTHVLVIPRSHYRNAGELAQGEPGATSHLFDAAREIAEAEGLDEGYRLVFNTGAARPCSTCTCTCSAGERWAGHRDDPTRHR